MFLHAKLVHVKQIIKYASIIKYAIYMPTYSYILSLRIIVCYVVSYKHAVTLYTHPVIFDQHFLIEHTEKYLWNFCNLNYMFLRLCLSLSDNILSSSYSTSLSNTVCTIFAVLFLEIIQLFCNYSLCSKVPIIPEIMPVYFVHPWTLNFGHCKIMHMGP